MQKKQAIVLAVILALVVLVWGWAFFRPGPPLEAEMLMTPDGPMVTFNGRVELYEVVVRHLDGTIAEDNEPGQIVWHMVPRDVEDAQPVETLAVIYGQPRGLGLRPAKGTRGRGRPLVPGDEYRLQADTSDGAFDITFTIPQ